MIPFVLLFVTAVLGCLLLAFLFSTWRDARREVAIAQRALGGDVGGAKALANQWDRGGGPRAPAARLRLAKAWSIAGDHQRALAILDRTQLPSGRMGRPLRRIASELRFDVLEALGEKEQAARVVDEAIEEDPRAPWLAKTGSTDPASSPGKRSVYGQGMLVKDAYRDYRFDEAADMTEAMIHRAARNPLMRPTLPFGYLALGSAQLAAGQDSAAEASFRQFVARSSDRDAAVRLMMKTRAEALLMGGRFQEAASTYEALVAEQGTTDVLAGLAMCHLRVGETERAARDLDRAVDLGYDADKARFLRAQILVDQGRSEEAVILAREAASSRPPLDPQRIYTLAYVLGTAQHPDAEAALRGYVELNPNDPDLASLLDRPAPDGRSWREYLESAPEPDL